MERMDKILSSAKIQQVFRAVRLFAVTFGVTLWAGLAGTKAAVVGSVLAAFEVAYRTAFKTEPVAGRSTNL